MENLSETFHAIKELLHPKALKEKDLMSHENPINLKAEKSYPVTLDDVTFSFGAGSAMKVSLFNDEDDKDDDAFICTKEKVPCTPIVFDTATEAYLKYCNSVSAKANQQVTLADIGFSLNLAAGGSARTVFYKKHPNAQLVRDAFAEDLKSFRTIFKFDDVAGLETGNGLGFAVNGTLSCNLKISWSNIIATGISTLSSQLPLPVTLDISLTPSLTADFSVSVTDDFAYLLTKQADGKYRASITKKKTTSENVALGASIGVQFADPTTLGQQVGAICDKVIQSVLGNTITEINAAVVNFKQGRKSPIVDKLFSLFHLDQLPQPIDLLTPKLKQLEQDISNTITRLATESVSFSFSYSYGRIKDDEEILSLVIGGDDLKRYHSDLLRMKTGRLLDSLRKNEIPYTLVSYLNQKVLTVTKSWGLGLTLFDFTLLTSKDYEKSTTNVQTDLKGVNTKVQIDREKGYKWQLLKGTGSWSGQISAVMAEFSPAPTLEKFGYTFQFNTVLKDPNVSEDDLRSYLDSAAVWMAVNAADIDGLAQKYMALKGKEVLVELKLSFPDKVMRAVLQQIASDGWGTVSKKQLARAMAAAMTWMADYTSRSNLPARQEMYAPLWSEYLDNPDEEVEDLASLAETEIRGLGDEDHLAEFEADRANWVFGNSFAGVVRSNPGLQGCLKNFVTGMVDLQHKIEKGAAYTVFDQSYDNIRDCLQYSFALTSVGRFLLLYASDLNLLKDVRRVLTLSYGPDSNRTVINCSVV
ncbi:MAG: hypothetical protein JST42_07665 [Bacteroidetes bacterium]|nr:hypothetical protein [Bacteroidota bacterium]